MGPIAGLISVKGRLYGTTAQGGANTIKSIGLGTVFSLGPFGGESVLHNFGGLPVGDGATPQAGLVTVKGTLYGTTAHAGANGPGTVFSITTSGTESVLHSFGWPVGDGAEPDAGLIDVEGTLYGTTEYGGANGAGTVFALGPFGAERVLHSFGASGDGTTPRAGLVNVNGTLYGTTATGGQYGIYGTVFSITPSGTERVLHSFGGSPILDGAYPRAGLVNVNGTLYGTTSAGGAYGSGTVFSLTP